MHSISMCVSACVCLCVCVRARVWSMSVNANLNSDRQNIQTNRQAGIGRQHCRQLIYIYIGRERKKEEIKKQRDRPRPRSSERRVAQGPRENLSSGPPLGRPKWEEIATRAPFSRRYLMVGTEARIRVSSVIFLPSSGTLRSQRMST